MTSPDLFTNSASASPSPAPRAFIEAQFPVSKLSKECYKERKAISSQTLTGLGKWWGRKPLVLVRATILGLLLPATDDPRRDREVFLRLMTMDPEGLLRRRKKFALKDAAERLAPSERAKYFQPGTTRLKSEHRKDADRVLDIAFSRRSYDEKLKDALRPEEVDGPAPEAWAEINAHLGTSASSLPELVRELGVRRFGHAPRVGDAFCGGGSIPFEAARIGCDAYGSDLNPVAALLTWAALNIVGGGPEVAERVRKAQREVYEAVDRQVAEWGIEHKTESSTGFQPVAGAEAGAEADPEDNTGRMPVLPSGGGDTGRMPVLPWLPDDPAARREVLRSTPRADAYLYCVEVRCPQTGWMVPLAPSWVVGEKTRTIAVLVPDRANKRYDIEIRMDAAPAEMRAAKEGTVRSGGRIVHPVLAEQGQEANAATVAAVRNAAGGLRPWENDDVVPRPGDVFQERIYCVRWVGSDGARWYAAATEHDIAREERVLELLRERFADWQAKGYIPSRTIEPGDKTDEPIRTRGWTHWHHLFNPRQLLVIGAWMCESFARPDGKSEQVHRLLWAGKAANNMSKLCRWLGAAGVEALGLTFDNQALNTLYNYAVRGTTGTESIPESDAVRSFANSLRVDQIDARAMDCVNDLWVTDPPYADAVSYHELTEFFLAWYERGQAALFPEWSTDSCRALAVVGRDNSFKQSMVSCYRNLAAHMPDNGFQVVMFTHQDASVWADLALILWAAGLRVTAAWCIATETESALKEGNYVQGTVLLVLRKQTGDASAFLDELYPEVEAEVRAQLDAMLALDDEEDPNFADTDYQLAAYAAALRVLTKYRRFEGRDVAHELDRARPKGEKGPVEKLIQDAVRVAADHLVPAGIDGFVWRTLSPAERFYLKGLDMEGHGEGRSGAYQELARGYGLREYRSLFASGQANRSRLRTPTEFGRRDIAARKEGGAEAGFEGSLLRHVLFAVGEVTRTGEASKGRMWLRTEWRNYWGDRQAILALLAYLARQGGVLGHWEEDAASARILAGAVENDHA